MRFCFLLFRDSNDLFLFINLLVFDALFGVINDGLIAELGFPLAAVTYLIYFTNKINKSTFI